jgi:hypothetical protein
MEDYYKKIPKSYLKQQNTYRNQHKTNISLPFRMLICGPSGARKSNSVMNIIQKFNCFSKIYLIAKTLEEPLYEYLSDVCSELEKRTGRSVLEKSNKLSDIQPCEAYDREETTLFVIDDMICEKDLTMVSDLFIRGRKFGISLLFVTQSYYKTPKLIRQNLTHLILKKINGKRDLNMILREQSLSKDVDEILQIYKFIVSQGDCNFFLIDFVTNNPNLTYRMNFTGITK